VETNKNLEQNAENTSHEFNMLFFFFLIEVAERKRRRRNPLPPIAGEQRGAPPTSTKLGNGLEEGGSRRLVGMKREGATARRSCFSDSSEELICLSGAESAGRQSYYVDSAV
jgi:hypothetical protein